MQPDNTGTVFGLYLMGVACGMGSFWALIMQQSRPLWGIGLILAGASGFLLRLAYDTSKGIKW